MVFKEKLGVKLCVCLGAPLCLQRGLCLPNSNVPCTGGSGSPLKLFHSPIMSTSDLLPSDISVLSSGRCNLHLSSTRLPSASAGREERGEWDVSGKPARAGSRATINHSLESSKSVVQHRDEQGRDTAGTKRSHRHLHPPGIAPMGLTLLGWVSGGLLRIPSYFLSP